MYFLSWNKPVSKKYNFSSEMQSSKSTSGPFKLYLNKVKILQNNTQVN